MGLLLFHSVWFGGKLVRSLDTVIRFHLILFGADLLYSGTLLSDYSPIQSCLPPESKVYQILFAGARIPASKQSLYSVITSHPMPGSSVTIYIDVAVCQPNTTWSS